MGGNYRAPSNHAITTQTSHRAATMKYLALALLLSTQLYLIHGACYRMMLEFGQTECEDPVDKTKHHIDAEWRNSACQDCTCTGCCDAFTTPLAIPDDCAMEFDKAKCEYKIYKKADPTQPCHAHSAVGK